MVQLKSAKSSVANLCLSPEVVFVGLPDFGHSVGLLVHGALHEEKTIY